MAERVGDPIERPSVVRLPSREGPARSHVSLDRFSEALDRSGTGAPMLAADAAPRAERVNPAPAAGPAVDRLTEVLEFAADAAAAPPRVALGARVANAAGFRYTRTRAVAVDAATLRANRIVLDDDGAGVASAYKLLRGQVLARMRENGWRTLAVTSPAPGAGKSVTSANLAVHIALELGATALLVDADLRSPSVAALFGMHAPQGLREFFTGEAAIETLLVHPDIGRLVLLPGSGPVSNSAEVMGSPEMGGLVAELRGRYDDRIVVFDLPSLAAADSLAMIHHVDAVLLVVAEGETDRDDLERANALLAGANVIGATLTKSREVEAPPDRSEGRGLLSRIVSRLGL